MNIRECTMAVMSYKDVDRVPVAHFGFWRETLKKWAREGHISSESAMEWIDGNQADIEIGNLLGFDFNWYSCFIPNTLLMPGFDQMVIREFDDGTRHVSNELGVIVVEKEGANTIPAEIDYTMKDRETWEKHYRWRLQWDPRRVTDARVRVDSTEATYESGGLEVLTCEERERPYGIHCGSLIGKIRNMIGLENLCYLEIDDPELFDEIVKTVAELCYQTVKYILESGARFDFGHFWEDVCCNNGPLVRPKVFAEKIGPHYNRITELLHEHGIEIISVDCDGQIESLVPTWLDNGINTMFPIEVGPWNANIRKWRETYGRSIRGVGGMNKKLLAMDRASIDEEIERLRGLVALGGYIPCPDHRIPPDAQWDLVRYYCDRAREAFSSA